MAADSGRHRKAGAAPSTRSRRFEPVITSPENPRVKEALRLRKGRERRRRGLFIAEGPREVGRAISAGLAVREIFLAPELLPDWGPSSSRLEAPHPQEVTARVLARLS